MAKYYVPFTYEKGGKIEVEAASPKEAMKAAEKKLDKMSWKKIGKGCPLSVSQRRKSLHKKIRRICNLPQ